MNKPGKHTDDLILLYKRIKEIDNKIKIKSKQNSEYTKFLNKLMNESSEKFYIIMDNLK